MSYFLIFSLIAIAGILAAIKWKHTDENYKPFLLVLICGVIFETANFIVGRVFGNTSPTSNTYVLISVMIWIWQFHKWKTFGRHPVIPYVIVISIILAWVINLIYVGGIFSLLIHYRIFSSFILVIIAVHQMNYYIVHHKGNLFKSALFLICTGILIQNTLKIMTECFYLTNTYGAHYTFWVGLTISIFLFIAAMQFLPKKKPQLSHF